MLLGDVNRLFVFLSLLTTSSNFWPLHLKQTFLPIIWIFNEGEDDGTESRLPFEIFEKNADSFFLMWVLKFWKYFNTSTKTRTLGLLPSVTLKRLEVLNFAFSDRQPMWLLFGRILKNKWCFFTSLKIKTTMC